MKKIVMFAILTVLMLIMLYPMITPVTAQPRRDLDIIWYTSSDAAWAAMLADEVDMIQWSLTKAQKEAAELNPDLQIASYTENGMMEFDLNNNLTIMDYPGKTNPISIEKVRHAVESLIDKDFIIATILEFFGSRIDAPVAYPQTEGWVYAPETRNVVNDNIGHGDGVEDEFWIKNRPIVEGTETIRVGGVVQVRDTDYEICYDNGRVKFKPGHIPPFCTDITADYTYQLSVVTYDWNHNGIIDPDEDNYPDKYDPNWAAELLASCSFGDTDGNGYLNYPNDPAVWGDAAGIDTTLMPLKICIRADHAHRRAAGRYLYRQLEGEPAVAGDSVLALSPVWSEYGKVGGDFDTTDETWVQPRPVLSPIVMRDRNYHIYTGGWSFGRFPTYLFSLFHSMFWYPYGPNYVTDHAHPDEDLILEDIYYAATLADAQAASKEYTRQHVLHCKNIPLWSYTSYVGWRKEVAGVVNMVGYGLVNDYTFLNAYRTDSPTAPLRMGVVSSWDRLNILYSQWYFEYALLDRVYTGLIAVNPYALAVDQPWVAQDWETGTWIDCNGIEKTKVTYYLREDVGCALPVTGNPAGNFNAHDFEFTIWYNYAFDDDWQWSSFMDIHHTKILDDYTVEVYFDDISMWFVYAPTYPLLGPKEELITELCEPAVATFTGAQLVEVAPGCYEYQFAIDPIGSVVQLISADVNGVPIIECTDFYIRAGYDVYCHNVFRTCTRVFAPTDVITLHYYKAIANGAGGLFLGGNLGFDWTDTMKSYGTHYPISISSTSAALNKNPYFFLETPLLGEIDWRWYWVAGPKPRSGYFRIDILDVVKCTGAYCSRGDGTFDPTYMPGADIDASDLCHVGILDLVTITGKYFRTFGTPP